MTGQKDHRKEKSIFLQKLVGRQIKLGIGQNFFLESTAYSKDEEVDAWWIMLDTNGEQMTIMYANQEKPETEEEAWRLLAWDIYEDGGERWAWMVIEEYLSSKYRTDADAEYLARQTAMDIASRGLREVTTQILDYIWRANR